MTSVLIREGEDAEEEREGQVPTEAETGVKQPQAKDYLEPQNLEQTKKDFP